MTMYLQRDIEKVITGALEQFPAIAITGPRQSGKTTMLREVFGNKYEYVTFDDPLNRQRAIDDPKLFLSQLKEYVILDEIQYVPEILHYLKMEIDNKRFMKGRFILTGSQQFGLIKGLSESLAGRIAIFSLLPFSYIEVNKHNACTTKTYFSDSSLKGLYPEIYLSENINNKLWYGSYLQTYLERDIRSVYNIGSLREFSIFLRLLASRCSQLLNMSALARDIGVSVNTIKAWISVLEAGHIIYLLQPWYRNLGKRITQSPKVYFVESALVTYLTGISTEELLFNGPMGGELFENLIISEALKSLYNRGERPEMYYLRTNNGVEADLITERNNKLSVYEIKMSQTPHIGMAKNFGQIVQLFPEFNFADKAIICMTDSDIVLSKDVSVFGLAGFIEKISI